MVSIDQSSIIYQDQWLVAINKPAGLLVHPSEIDPGESQSAMKLLRDLLNTWVFPVHRLDKSTSGVLLFTFSSQTAAEISTAFEKREVKKHYHALVRGFTQPAETIDYPLKKLYERKRDKKKVRPDLPPQQAITEYQRISTIELPIAMPPHPSARYSFIQVSPHTGRLRQIRRHMKHIFHPIIGDQKHGDRNHNKMFKEKFDCNRMLLHASSLSFMHPVNHENLCMSAPLPEDFRSVLLKTGIHIPEI